MEEAELKDKLVFDIEDRGYNIKAWYNKTSDAYVEVSYNHEIIKKFLYPSYKVFNLAAHFGDIVDGELSMSDKDRGYLIAGSDGLGGYVMPQHVDSQY